MYMHACLRYVTNMYMYYSIHSSHMHNAVWVTTHKLHTLQMAYTAVLQQVAIVLYKNYM